MGAKDSRVLDVEYIYANYVVSRSHPRFAPGRMSCSVPARKASHLQFILVRPPCFGRLRRQQTTVAPRYSALGWASKQSKVHCGKRA